ncbi:hypothetical protein B0H16DRAFT_1469270 [Mycena metata]|uniref:Uncharacterized protein n=1 Tax=Mycena metata TaxID=1033252 RepID=A0AAD7HY36_9AGAR|nr:hypothetical protein B0H16DRAFT_1469270 [Mycena metata]
MLHSSLLCSKPDLIRTHQLGPRLAKGYTRADRRTTSSLSSLHLPPASATQDDIHRVKPVADVECVRRIAPYLWLVFTLEVFSHVGRWWGIKREGKVARFGKQWYPVVYFAVVAVWGWRVRCYSSFISSSKESRSRGSSGTRCVLRGSPSVLTRDSPFVCPSVSCNCTRLSHFHFIPNSQFPLLPRPATIPREQPVGVVFEFGCVCAQHFHDPIGFVQAECATIRHQRAVLGIPTVPYTVTTVRITVPYGQQPARNRNRTEILRGPYGTVPYILRCFTGITVVNRL